MTDRTTDSDRFDTATWLHLVNRLERLAASYRHRPLAYWPTVRELARRLRVRQAEVLDLAEDSERLDTVIGAQIPGGGGHYQADTIGDYSVEWLGNEGWTQPDCPG